MPANAGARIGLQPRREKSGEIERERESGMLTNIPALHWTRGAGSRASLGPGDVVYVEPIDGKPQQYRLRQIPEVSGAIIVMDPYTGRVFAMVGGFSFDQSEFNRATQAMRQPGSSFKPFVYATALDNGYTPSSIVLDAPIEIDQGPGLGVWRPENFEGTSSGPHTLRYGVEHSINQMTVRLARDVGMPLIAEYAKRFGIYDDLPPYLANSLGAGETTLMRLTTAYSMLANGGKRIKETLIDRIQDRWGHTIYRHDERICEGCDAPAWENQEEPRLIDKREQVLDPLTAYQITSIMEGVIQRGTGVAIKEVGKHLAGKTGTTNDMRIAGVGRLRDARARLEQLSRRGRVSTPNDLVKRRLTARPARRQPRGAEPAGRAGPRIQLTLLADGKTLVRSNRRRQNRRSDPDPSRRQDQQPG